MTSANEPAGGAIRFILDGKLQVVSDVDPTTTVLQYLREHLRRTGTKEGCAEGDCGACTVVLAELEGDEVRYRAINSCIRFLPTIDGKELFTVETLARNGKLHPVQQAMVDAHGSQCGFCTPGFVMSLFALYRSRPYPGRHETADVLAGNLCRCTGYRPILDAAERMYEAEADDWDSETVADRLRAIRRKTTLELTATSANGSSCHYLAPTTTGELARLVERHPEARLLAGGTDVGLWVTKQHRDLDAVIYLGDVEELDFVKADADAIEVGASTTWSDAFDAFVELHPDFEELLRRFGSPPIRNSATVVGNIANGSPIGDSMPALIALGAELSLRHGDSRRRLPLDEFYLAYQKTALEPGELIESVRVPRPRAGESFRTYKISKRFDQDISAVCGAFWIRTEGEVVAEARVCFGGMAATPKRAPGCEERLTGAVWNETTVFEAMKALDSDYQPIDDMRASARYRATVARNLLFKFFLETGGAVNVPRLGSVAR